MTGNTLEQRAEFVATLERLRAEYSSHCFTEERAALAAAIAALRLPAGADFLDGWGFRRADFGKGEERTITTPSGNIVTVANRGRLECRVLFELADSRLAAAPRHETGG